MFFSAFAPFGMLDFSSDTSEGEKVYDAMVAGFIDPRDGRPSVDLSVDPTNYQEGKIYATAMAIAAANVTLRRGGANLRGETSYELLEAHEHRFSISPAPADTVPQRRAVLAARQKISRGPRHEAIAAGLGAILGSELVRYRVLDTLTEANAWPANPALGPGIFPNPAIPARLVRITDPVVGIAAAPFTKTVSYENWNPVDAEIRLRAEDELCVQPENMGLAEKVTVLSVAGSGATRTFTAIFQKPHDQGCSATTGPVPLWTSTKRFVLIVVKAASAIDAEKRRRVDEFMARISRACTTWAIVQPSNPGAVTVGAFQLDISPLGAVPLGVIAI